MQKLSKFFTLLALLGFSYGLQAQITLLDETLLTEASFGTFTTVNVTGTQYWNLNTTYGAVCSGYSGGQNYENEDWLITPAMNLSQMDDTLLTFSHTRGNASVLNVGVSQGWYKVFATANYTGNPATTNWIELEGLNQDVPSAWQYISSGSLSIPQAARSANTRIAFRYICSATQSATWEIKNVKVIGSTANTFKITNWNAEWLGCTEFGPTNEELQISNVAAAMLSMNADVYCLQEVSNTNENPSIETLVELMGSSEWGGNIVPSNTGDCNQRQGIIYKKSKVQFVNSMQLSTGSPAQGNTYYYNWTSGRYPALYNVNLISGSTLIPVSLVNIHAKAEDDNNPTNYTRRLGASEALKTILDGTEYNSKNVILIGDFNDYLVGTTSDACDCTDSPYKNFMDDAGHYTGITQGITNVNSWAGNPIIENIIISNELVGNYIPDSAVQEVSVPNTIEDYYYTTSDHLPVSAVFQFDVLSSPEIVANQASWTIYPNPVNEELFVSVQDAENGSLVEVYDMAGRKMLSQKLGDTAINVASFPSGIYLIRIGNRIGKFVKQ